MTLLNATGTSGNRNLYFAAVVIAAFLNFVFASAGQSVFQHGFWPAIYSTFDISAIIWIAVLYSVSLLLEAQDDTPPGHLDMVVLVLLAALVFIPHKYTPVLALSGLSLYLILRSSKDDIPIRKAAILLAAITVPLLWGRLVMILFNDFILTADAWMVSLFAQLDRIGNVVVNNDAQFYIKISKGCSSLSNISLGVLSWTFFVLLYDRHYQAFKYYWLFAILAPIVLINVGRMALIVLNPDWYEYLHDGPGEDVANLVTLAVILGVSYLGIQKQSDKT